MASRITFHHPRFILTVIILILVTYALYVLDSAHDQTASSVIAPFNPSNKQIIVEDDETPPKFGSATKKEQMGQKAISMIESLNAKPTAKSSKQNSAGDKEKGGRLGNEGSGKAAQSPKPLGSLSDEKSKGAIKETQPSGKGSSDSPELSHQRAGFGDDLPVDARLGRLEEEEQTPGAKVESEEFENTNWKDVEEAHMKKGGKASSQDGGLKGKPTPSKSKADKPMGLDSDRDTLPSKGKTKSSKESKTGSKAVIKSPGLDEESEEEVLSPTQKTKANIEKGIDADGASRWGDEADESKSSEKAMSSKDSVAAKAKPKEGVSSWTFDVRRDGNNFGLSEEQCDIAFPKMYNHLEEMVERFSKNSIERAEIDAIPSDGNRVKAMIYDGELYILSDTGLEKPNTRGMATIQAINRALIAYPNRTALPNCEFAFYTQDGQDMDKGVHLWAYTKSQGKAYEQIWLMPDFGFFSWPEPKVGSYSEIRRKIAAVDEEIPFAEKDDRLVWRGANLTEQRHSFIQTAANKDWADIRVLDWFDKTNIKKNLLPIAEHCKYQFVMHVSGYAWSAQGKYMHNCNSVFVTHQLDFAEIYDNVLEASGPEQNYVQVRDDWSDLEETIQSLRKNPKRAQQIAQQSTKVLRDRYLTPAAEACYWRGLIRAYGSVSFEPEFYEDDGKTWRGVPFDSIALTRKVSWEAH